MNKKLLLIAGIVIVLLSVFAAAAFRPEAVAAEDEIPLTLPAEVTVEEAAQLREEGAISSHPYDKVVVFLRLFLVLSQGIGLNNVKLDVQAHIWHWSFFRFIHHLSPAVAEFGVVIFIDWCLKDKVDQNHDFMAFEFDSIFLHYL